MTDTLNLPFEYTHDSLNSWLKKLDKVEHKVAASQIFNILKLLNIQTAGLENLLMVFDALTPMVLCLTKIFVLQSEKEIEIPVKTHKLSKLNSHLVRTLALGYFEIMTHPDFAITFKSSEKKLIINRTLIFFGQTQKLNALHYEFPSTSLWKNMGILYQMADKAGLVQENYVNGSQIKKGDLNITNNIKFNLLFAIINPYQYSQNNISAIYSLFQQHAHLLEITRSDFKNDSVATYFWDFHTNRPPQPDKPLRADLLLINPAKIVDPFYSSTFLTGNATLPKHICRKIQTTLSSYNNIFKDIKPAPPELVYIIHGFQKTVEFLGKENQRTKFFQAAPKLNRATTHKILEIEPMDQQQGKSHNTTADNWVDAVNLPGATTGSFFQTQDPDFYVVVLQKVQLKLNDLAIINNAGGKTIFGIIRQKQNAPIINTQQYLLESKQGKFSFIQFRDHNSSKKTGLLIENNDESLDVYLSPEKIASGTVIQIYSNKYQGNYFLTRLLELTPNLMRYRIISC